MQSKRTGPQLKTMDIRNKLLQLYFIKPQENLYKTVNKNMFSFTFSCKFSCICNFAIFVRIFMKFSPKCRTNKFGMIYTILGSFSSFFNWKRADILELLRVPEYSDIPGSEYKIEYEYLSLPKSLDRVLFFFFFFYLPFF